MLNTQSLPKRKLVLSVDQMNIYQQINNHRDSAQSHLTRQEVLDNDNVFIDIEENESFVLGYN